MSAGDADSRDEREDALVSRVLWGEPFESCTQCDQLEQAIDESWEVAAAAATAVLVAPLSEAPPPSLVKRLNADAAAFLVAQSELSVDEVRPLLPRRELSADRSQAHGPRGIVSSGSVASSRGASWSTSPWSAVVVLAAVLALAAWLSWPGTTAEPSYADQFARLEAAAPVDLVRLPWQWKADDPQWVAGGGVIRGELLWSTEQQIGFMRLRNAPANAPGRQYQLWIFDERPASGQHPVDGGVFDVPPDQAGAQAGAGDGPDIYVPIRPKIAVRGRPKFAVTVEDQGGVVVSRREQILVAAGLLD